MPAVPVAGGGHEANRQPRGVCVEPRLLEYRHDLRRCRIARVDSAPLDIDPVPLCHQRTRRQGNLMNVANSRRVLMGLI